MRATINIKGVIGFKEAFVGTPYEAQELYGVADFIAAVKTAGEAEGYDIYIDSPGGLVDEGFRIASLIEGLSNTKTIAVNVASIANVIFFAGQERVAKEGAEFMLHTASGGTFGNAQQMREYAAELEQVDRRIAAYIVQRTEMSEEQVLSLMAIDRYLDAEQATALGFFNKARKAAKAYAITQNKKREKMDLKAHIKAASDALKKAFGSNKINMAVPLEGGGEIWVETEDGALLGRAVFVSEGGEPLPDGEYTISDGRVLKVVSGTIEEEEEVAGEIPEGGDKEKEMLDKLNAAETRIKELETALQEMTTQYDTAMERAASAETNVQNLAIQVQGLARKVSPAFNAAPAAKPLGGQNNNAKIALSDAEQEAALLNYQKKKSNVKIG